MNSPTDTPDVTANRDPETQPPAEASRISFLRLFSASLLSMLIASFAAVIAAFLIIGISYGASGADVSDALSGLLVGMFIALLVGGTLLAVVSTVVGRALVRVFTKVTVKYWQAFVALVPIQIVFMILSNALGDSSAASLFSLLLSLVVAPSIGALILTKFAENESA